MSGFNQREKNRLQRGVAASMIESKIEGINQQPLEMVKNKKQTNKGKNVHVSIYLTSEQLKALRMQDAEKVKGADRSSIARVGIDIILALSNEEYLSAQSKANQKGVDIAQIMKEALAEYLKKSE